MLGGRGAAGAANNDGQFGKNLSIQTTSKTEPEIGAATSSALLRPSVVGRGTRSWILDAGLIGKFEENEVCSLRSAAKVVFSLSIVKFEISPEASSIPSLEINHQMNRIQSDCCCLCIKFCRLVLSQQSESRS